MKCTDASCQVPSRPMYYILQQSAQHILSIDAPRLILETEHLFLQTEKYDSYQTAVTAATRNI